MDPFVVGVLTAAALPYLVRLRLSSRAVGLDRNAPRCCSLVPLLYWCDDDLSYLRWGGTVLEWDVALFFVAVALGGTSAFVTAVTGTRLATWLGRNSLLLYIWHFPVFVFVARHTVGDGWSWEARTVVALTATVVICILADRLLERRVKEWLRRPAWRDLDDGVPHLPARRAGRDQLFAHVGSERDDRSE